MRTIRPPYNKRPRAHCSGGRQIHSYRICRSKPSSPRRVKTFFQSAQSDQSGQRTIDRELTIPPICLRHRGPREQPQRLRRSQLIDIAVTHRDCGRQPGHAEGADGTCLFEPFDHTLRLSLSWRSTPRLELEAEGELFLNPNFPL